MEIFSYLRAETKKAKKAFKVSTPSYFYFKKQPSFLGKEERKQNS
jgi:hypothetical protein